MTASGFAQKREIASHQANQPKAQCNKPKIQHDVLLFHRKENALRRHCDSIRKTMVSCKEIIRKSAKLPTRPRRMLAAAWLDGVRLIDNIPV
jgi:pantoate--beta-alanine ligase